MICTDYRCHNATKLSSAHDSHLGLVLELALALHSQRAVKNSGRELEAVVHRLDVRVRKAADVKQNIDTIVRLMYMNTLTLTKNAKFVTKITDTKTNKNILQNNPPKV